MATTLLLIIYIAFIGLGIPHSLFGAVWPAIQTDFVLPLDAANYITTIISGCTVISSMLGARLTNKFGTSTVVTVSLCLSAMALLGFSFAGGLVTMCLFSIPLGLSSGAIDASLNNYIALHYSAIHMNFLHCFYGIGVMTSPYIMSLTLNTAQWRFGYRVIFLIQAVIALIMIFSLPLWKKARFKKEESVCDDITYKNLSYIKMAKMPSVRLDWLMCISANAIEGVGGLWGSTYLVFSHGFGEAEAAGAITLFYIGMAGGRFLSGILSTRLKSWTLIKIGTVVMMLGIILLPFSVTALAVTGLFLIGLGNGPIYPNIMHLTPRHFGEEYSGSIVGSQMAAAYFGIMVAPPVFGALAKRIGTAFYPGYIALWAIIFIISALFFLRKVNLERE